MTCQNTRIRLIAVALFAFATFFLVGLVWRNIKLKNAETAELLVSLGAAENAERQAQAIRVIEMQASRDILALETLALTNDRLISLIESIEEAGRLLKLDLEIASFEKKEEGIPQIIRIAINTKGSWMGTSSFLQAIESLPYRVLIETASLAKSGNVWKGSVVFALHSFQ